MNKKIFLVLAAGLLFAQFAFAASSLGTLNENIAVGKVLSIGLNTSSTGNWYFGSNSNSAVASGNISSNSLFITGKSVGSTVISACTDTQNNNCMQVTVNVSAASQVLGASIVSPHPVKSWVLQGQTVFYVDTNGLIPITTWKIFLNNGGKQSLIKPANSGDLALPMESLMVLHDSRVQK